ncbi:hypothetical protein [Nitriliruptor alkaliphilus]|uniref:hypothetical protein n=1 Tax=Nitriliruptor alkaliphilus TaxID=427918 RepID=UPI00069770FE|nr:hypothetical protein [Nitriliruptor alkaliphilus]
MSRTDEPPADAGPDVGVSEGELRPPPADLPLTQTRAGRRLSNVVAVLLLGAMLVSNLPDSELREQLRLVERPITDVTGLSQNWALFAPNPRSTFLRLRAEIERVDGTVEEWIPPVGDRIVGVYRTYRWRKWANGVVDPEASRLHRGAAGYLRVQFDDPDAAPIAEIRLFRGTHRQPRPGSGEAADRTPTFEEELLFRSAPADDAEVDP